MKKISGKIYTKGKINYKKFQTENVDSIYLYSRGKYPTKITEQDIPEDYIKIRSSSTWYLTAYLKTSNVIDIEYKYLKRNHLFKDDCIIISYSGNLIEYKDKHDFTHYKNEDIRIYGNDIIPILLSVEKNSNIDTTKVRNKILEKINWYKENCDSNSEREFLERNPDLFEYYSRKI